MFKKNIMLNLLIGAIILTPILSLAAVGTQPTVNISTPTDVTNIIINVFNFLLYILVFLASIFLIYAAYLYLTAAGDAEKVGQAKNIIIYAVVALAIGLVAWTIPALINNILK